MSGEELEMTIDLTDPATPVVILGGDIDLVVASQIRKKLVDLAASSGSLVVDLTGVAFIDSTGLGVLVQARNRVHEQGGRLVVVTDNPRVQRLFEIAGLLDVFDVVGIRDEVLGKRSPALDTPADRKG